MKVIDAEHFLISATLDKSLINEPGVYPYTLPIVQQLKTITFDPRVTFFIGENGAGKSTLLEALAIAYGFNPEGGSRNFNFSTKATHSSLHRALILTRGIIRPKDGFFLRAETFYNLATQIDTLDGGQGDKSRFMRGYGGKSLHGQSHGESFLSLLLHRFSGQGLYFLDEPEAALSPQRQLATLIRLHQLAESGSQFIIATHSPILMAYPQAKILLVTETGLQEVRYQDTEHYILTKDFLNDPDRMIKALLKDNSES